MTNAINSGPSLFSTASWGRLFQLRGDDTSDEQLLIGVAYFSLEYTTRPLKYRVISKVPTLYMLPKNFRSPTFLVITELEHDSETTMILIIKILLGHKQTIVEM